MPADEYAPRRRLIAAGLETRQLDAMLISSPANVRYLSGFTGSNGMLLVAGDETVLFTDPRYAIQSRQETSCKTRIAKGPLIAGIAAAARRHRIRRLGFERAHLSYDAYDVLRANLSLSASLEPVVGWLEAHRMLKSPAEIERIRRSAATNSKAFEQALRVVRPGVSESAIAAEIEYRMRRLGAQQPSFETIVAFGARTALPHASPTAAELSNRQLLLIDMGALQDGYASDMTRMLFLGTPNQRVRSLYRTVLEAHEAARDAVRPGATAAHVDRQARRVLAAAKLDRYFVHSTGHGLGLEIHEPPRIGRKDKTVLRAGMAITIEPGVYLEGYGGIRIEDTIEVTETGCRSLTPTSKELRII